MTAAIESFESHREALHSIIKFSFITVANSLYSNDLISSESLDAALDWSKPMDERCSSLLNHVKSSIETEPSKFSVFIKILNSEPYSQPLVDKILSKSTWLR